LPLHLPPALRVFAISREWGRYEQKFSLLIWLDMNPTWPGVGCQTALYPL